MKRPRRNFWRWLWDHKVSAGIITGVVVLLAGYGIWSVVSWQQYRAQYESALARSKSGIDAALILPQETNEEKDHKIASLNDLNPVTVDCHTSGLFHWQKIFGGLQTVIDECTDAAKKLTTLNAAVQSVAVYLQDEQKLLGAMTKGEISDRIDEETFETQVNSWQNVQKDLASLEVSEGFKPVQSQAQEAVKAIHDAWQRLLDAHKAKDQSAYEEVRAKLPESYDRLAAIAPTADSQLVELTKALQTAYSDLFS